jgi:hypothetical protein
MKLADLITDRAVVICSAAGWIFCLAKGIL